MKKKQLNKSEISIDTLYYVLHDRAVRKAITINNHYMFFHLYFSQYVKYVTADFQKEMFKITEDESIEMAIIVAFRGSAKSTIMTMSYPIWAILGKLQKKCVLILSQTQQQVRIHMANIKKELESNELLKMDLGPFQEETAEWGSSSIIISSLNAKITAASSEQGIRGIRHGEIRPDLIICDDVEDINSTKTQEGRNKTYDWFKGEIIPCGDKNTKIIVIGNLLHEDSLLMRLKKSIDNNEIDAVFKEFPLIKDDKVLWPGQYTDDSVIQKMKRKVGDEKSWQREYMLQIIADEDQIIKREWIQYYETLPDDISNYRSIATGIDLAIANGQSADYTAMVSARIYGYGDSKKIYILPNPINERLSFPATRETIEMLVETSGESKVTHKLYIENVAYQMALIQEMNEKGYNAEGVSPHGNNKRARLNLISYYIKQGMVLFPKRTAENLINQLIYFGSEKHDDLADAIAILLSMVCQKERFNGAIICDFDFGHYSDEDWSNYEDKKIINKINNH